MACSWTVGGVPTSKDSCRTRYLTCARKEGFDYSISRHCLSRTNRHHVRTLEHVQPILVFQVLIANYQPTLNERRVSLVWIDWTLFRAVDINQRFTFIKSMLWPTGLGWPSTLSGIMTDQRLSPCSFRLLIFCDPHPLPCGCFKVR